MNPSDAIPIPAADPQQPDAGGRPRPTGITLLALLALLTVVLVPIATPSPLVATLGAFGILGVVVLSLALACGLWELRSWAWPLAILFWAIGFIDALLLLTAGTINTNLVVAPLVVAYLNRSAIRRLFGR
ncbi:MAG TPA: hypothetical protein VFI28_07645 [Candidatus Limnocylindrales bacterium]|nr:hypothetical protein [Candidatus Limnocylindrales bacterium]